MAAKEKWKNVKRRDDCIMMDRLNERQAKSLPSSYKKNQQRWRSSLLGLCFPREKRNENFGNGTAAILILISPLFFYLWGNGDCLQTFFSSQKLTYDYFFLKIVSSGVRDFYHLSSLPSSAFNWIFIYIFLLRNSKIYLYPSSYWYLSLKGAIFKAIVLREEEP